MQHLIQQEGPTITANTSNKVAHILIQMIVLSAHPCHDGARWGFRTMPISVPGMPMPKQTAGYSDVLAL
jgi:hypothetical protein